MEVSINRISSKVRFLAIVLALCLTMATSVSTLHYKLEFSPTELNLVFEDDLCVVNVTYNTEEVLTDDNNDTSTLFVSSDSVQTAYIVRNHTFTLTPSNRNNTFTIYVKAKRLGETFLKFTMVPESDSDIEDYPVTVIRRTERLSSIFLYSIICISIIANLVMGTDVYLDLIKKLIKRPIALVIAAVCQFIFMPLISFGLLKLFDLDSMIALGLFLVACAPGGGLSNMSAFLVDGEMSLSITMTFFSTLLAMGLMPANILVYTHWISNSTISADDVPFGKLAQSMLGLCAPVAVGMAIRHLAKDRLTKFMVYAKPIILIMFVTVISLGVYDTLYIYQFWTADSVIVSFLQPLLGILLAAVVALIFRQRLSAVKTIALEVGVQNEGLIIATVKLIYPQPQSDLIIITPITIVLMTTAIVCVAICVHSVGKKFCSVYRRKVDEDIAAMKEEGTYMNRKKTWQTDQDVGEVTPVNKYSAVNPTPPLTPPQSSVENLKA